MTTMQQYRGNRPVGGGPEGSEIFLESTRTALLVWSGGAATVRSGSRIGAGMRRVASDGAMLYRSFDDGAERAEIDGWSAESENPWTGESDLAAASAWIEGAASAVAAAVPGALRSRLALSATAQMYRQVIAVAVPVPDPGTARDEERASPVRDVRTGARIEISVTLGPERSRRRRLADVDIHRLS